MMTRRPSHPGKILLNHFITARGLTVKSFAAVMDVSEDLLQKIVDGNLNVSPCMAVRLGRYLNTSTHLWLNLQAAYDAAGNS